MKYKKKSFDFGYEKKKKLLPHLLRRCLYGTKKQDRGTRLRSDLWNLFFSRDQDFFFCLLFFYMMTAFQKKKRVESCVCVWETKKWNSISTRTVLGSLPRFLLLANKTPKWHTTRSSPKLFFFSFFTPCRKEGGKNRSRMKSKDPLV